MAGPQHAGIPQEHHCRRSLSALTVGAHCRLSLSALTVSLSALTVCAHCLRSLSALTVGSHCLLSLSALIVGAHCRLSFLTKQVVGLWLWAFATESNLSKSNFANFRCNLASEKLFSVPAWYVRELPGKLIERRVMMKIFHTFLRHPSPVREPPCVII